MLDFSLSQSTDEDWNTVPDNLEDFSWWQLRNITFQIGISIVSLPAVESTNNGYGVEPGKAQKCAVVDGTEGIQMSSPDLCFVFIMYSSQSILMYLFSSNQLSIVVLKSMWSPKFPGLDDVTKKLCFSGTRCVPDSFLVERLLYSLMKPNL